MEAEQWSSGEPDWTTAEWGTSEWTTADWAGSEWTTAMPGLVAAHNLTHQGMVRGQQALLGVAYLAGLVGNSAALCFLLGCSKYRPPRNAKHSLMLVSLAFNDLVAMVGMSLLMACRMYLPLLYQGHAFCVVRVIWRSFGLGSGSIVIVMAIERWFALTRPFYYQKYITIGTIKKGMVVLWLAVLALSCLPLFGFGLYWQDGRCRRYKEATLPFDSAYAYLYFSYVLILLLSMVWCNVGVMRALVPRQGARTTRAVLVRRISRNKDLASSSTKEELAFARVMGLLCTVFYVCWVPQLISIPMAQLYPKSKFTLGIIHTADLLMLCHFSVDPYFYVLQRWPLLKSLLCKKNKKWSSRPNSTKTTQELVTL